MPTMKKNEATTKKSKTVKTLTMTDLIVSVGEWHDRFYKEEMAKSKKDIWADAMRIVVAEEILVIVQEAIPCVMGYRKMGKVLRKLDAKLLKDAWYAVVEDSMVPNDDGSYDIFSTEGDRNAKWVVEALLDHAAVKEE